MHHYCYGRQDQIVMTRVHRGFFYECSRFIGMIPVHDELRQRNTERSPAAIHFHLGGEVTDSHFLVDPVVRPHILYRHRRNDSSVCGQPLTEASMSISPARRLRPHPTTSPQPRRAPSPQIINQTRPHPRPRSTQNIARRPPRVSNRSTEPVNNPSTDHRVGVGVGSRLHRPQVFLTRRRHSRTRKSGPPPRLTPGPSPASSTGIGSAAWACRPWSGAGPT